MADVTEREDGSVEVNFGNVTQPTVSANLAERLDEKKLEKIGKEVVDNFNQDLTSRSEWEKRRANWYKLFAVQRSPKTHPWPGASNVGIPTMSIAVVQFSSRAYEQLFSGKEIVRGFWTDGNKKDTALRVGKHMDYQLKYEMEGWDEDMDAMLIKLPIDGSCFKKTYYDHRLKRPVSRYIAADDFVVHYGVRTLEDAIRKTHVLRLHKDDLMIREKGKELINVSGLSEDPTEITINTGELEDAREEVSGQTKNPNEDEKINLRPILEQHAKLDLNDDGIGEDYIITVDYNDEKVLRIEPSSFVNAKGVETPITFFTHYEFIPNPEGLYAFGFGHMLEGINESINTIMNQLIDAGTLSTTIAGLISSRSGLKTGDLKFKMGEFKSVDIPIDDIKKAIYQFEFDAPSNTLFTLLGTLQEYASKITSVSDSMLGQMPSSDTTATAMLAVLEQGLKVFSTIQRRIHRSFGKELKKIFRLNSIYLDEQVYFTVQDSATEEFKSLESGRLDYNENIDVIPVSDPNIISKAERLIKAKEVYEFGINNPLIAENDMGLYELSKEYLRATDTPNIDEVLKKPEPQEPPDLTPEEEHAELLREVGANVLPQQDHVAHQQAHEAFQESAWAEQLTPQGKKLLEAHMRDTAAALYLQENPPEVDEGAGLDEGGLEGVA